MSQMFAAQDAVYTGSFWDSLKLNAGAAVDAVGNVATNPIGAVGNAQDYYADQAGGNSDTFKETVSTGFSTLKTVAYLAIAGAVLYLLIQAGGLKRFLPR